MYISTKMNASSKAIHFFLYVALLVPLRFFTCERQLCVTELFLYPIKRIRSRTFSLLYEKIKELHFAIAREHDVNFNWVFMNSPSSFDPIKMSFFKFDTFYVTWSVNYIFEYTLLHTSEPLSLFSAQIYKTWIKIYQLYRYVMMKMAKFSHDT